MKELHEELKSLVHSVSRIKNLISSNTTSFEKSMIDYCLSIESLISQNKQIEGAISTHCKNLDPSAKTSKSFIDWCLFFLKQEETISTQTVENETQKHYLIEAEKQLNLLDTRPKINENLIDKISSQHKKNIKTLKYLEESAKSLERQKNKLVEEYKNYEVEYENKVASMGLNVRLGKNVYEALYCPDMRSLNQYTKQVLDLPLSAMKNKEVFRPSKRPESGLISKVTESLVDAFKKTPTFSVPRTMTRPQPSLNTEYPRPDKEARVTFRVQRQKAYSVDKNR